MSTQIFSSAQTILRGLKNLHIITEGEQKIFSDLLLRLDQFKDIYLLRKYNTLLYRFIDQLQIEEFKPQQFIYQDGKHNGIKYFLIGGEVVYTRQNEQLNQITSKQILYQKLEEKSQINASENKKRAFQLIQDMKINKTKPIRELYLGEQFGSREDYNNHLVFKARRLEQEYQKLKESLDFNQSLSVQALSDCIVVSISQEKYDLMFQPFILKLKTLIQALSQSLMNIKISEQEMYETEYFAHYYDENVYQQREILIQQGMPTDYLYFVKSGQVQIQKSITELYRYGSGQYILCKNFLNSKSYEHNVQILDPETIVTRIQRYFLYLMLNLKSLSNKPISSVQKQTIVSLYQSNSNSGTKQSIPSPLTQASLTSNSQISMFRQSHTILDCSSILSSYHSQREINTPISLQQNNYISSIQNTPSSSNLQKQTTLCNSIILSKKMSQSSGSNNNNNTVNGSFGLLNSQNQGNLTQIENQDKALKTARPLSSNKRRIIIPTKSKIYQNFQRSISANLRKRQENKLIQETIEQSKQVLGDQDTTKRFSLESEQVEIAVLKQPMNATTSSLVKQPKLNGLKRTFTVSFLDNDNEEEDNKINTSTLYHSEKIGSVQSQSQSQRSSVTHKEDSQISTRHSSKKSTAIYIKPKILNAFDIFSDTPINSNTPLGSLTQSANLNDHPNTIHHSKFNIYNNQNRLSKNSSTPKLSYIKIQADQAKDQLNINKAPLSCRMLSPPNIKSSHYFINKNSKNKSLYNSNSSNNNNNNSNNIFNNTSNSSNNSNNSFPNKNLTSIKSLPLKKSNFVQYIFDNSHNNNSNFKI
ncbi:cyclic nucleotide-binding domain protein (macronuclear) [Tetrahymena thermophila SB210]|uniref:Cyclic nucleotide-binding domain protein n=1 Tax=Tetrahymena thermophila (strain SB210) TaxID=312017 RepID=I7MIW6_TETTS|nr:cyclic nucleotide-binding domain protein [Tetrahymena thermophila SB210]EAS04809.1 cyclic nucleotide-binding domain protein [Tetrahymena thermophila SB210]|eukprot:XP_001025054.1 cyclic nucleotide-binding domain protein [Tetrahymena thermophila SB210]